MTMDLVPALVEAPSPPRHERPALALGVFTLVKVALACIAILVVFPAVMAAQGALAR